VRDGIVDAEGGLEHLADVVERLFARVANGEPHGLSGEGGAACPSSSSMTGRAWPLPAVCIKYRGKSAGVPSLRQSRTCAPEPRREATTPIDDSRVSASRIVLRPQPS
jgi:hypothetical protein